MSRLKTDAIRNVNASVDGITLDTSGNVAIPNELQLADKIVHTGDTNTAIRFPSADVITAETSGTERLRITSDGQVQIGGDSGVTGSWSQTHWNLEVHDSAGDAYALLAGVSGAALELRDTVSSEAVVLAANGGCNLYSYKAGDDMGFHTKTSGGSISERLRITSDGKVAIGFNAPAVAGLSIANGSTSLGFEFDTGSGFSGGPTIRGYYRPGSAYKSLGITGSDIKFGINDVEKIRIDANGYLGLGINDPHLYYAKELVVKAASEGGITIRNTGANDWNYIMFATGTSGSSRYSGWIAYDHGDNKLKIAVNEDVSGKGFEFLANGNLEIKDGNLIVASGHGIDFSATGNGTGSNQAELFADYETGTWTPANQYLPMSNIYVQHYYRIGNIVTCNFDFQYASSPADTSQTGSYIEGLPFTASSPQHSTCQYNAFNSDFTPNAHTSGQIIYAAVNGTNAYIYYVDGGRKYTRGEMAGKRIIGTFTYHSSY